MDYADDGETSYNTFVDDVAFEPTYLQALLTAAGRNVATVVVVAAAAAAAVVTSNQQHFTVLEAAADWAEMTT